MHLDRDHATVARIRGNPVYLLVLLGYKEKEASDSLLPLLRYG
jgi:hypothetical protein